MITESRIHGVPTGSRFRKAKEVVLTPTSRKGGVSHSSPCRAMERVCFLLIGLVGTYVLGPITDAKTPDVGKLSVLSPV